MKRLLLFVFVSIFLTSQALAITFNFDVHQDMELENLKPAASTESELLQDAMLGGSVGLGNVIAGLTNPLTKTDLETINIAQ